MKLFWNISLHVLSIVEDNIDDDDKSQAGNETEDSEAETSKVVNAYNYAQNYKYDSKYYLWCEIIFAVSIS